MGAHVTAQAQGNTQALQGTQQSVQQSSGQFPGPSSGLSPGPSLGPSRTAVPRTRTRTRTIQFQNPKDKDNKAAAQWASSQYVQPSRRCQYLPLHVQCNGYSHVV